MNAESTWCPSPSRPPLDPDRLAAAPERAPGTRVEVVEEVASTNATVVERAGSGEPEGLVVAAEHQTAARGRLDRTWEAPARSALVFSVLLRPAVPARSWPWLPLLTGYAVGRALRARGYDAGVKWPNDVLLGDRKVAGILVERVESPVGPAAVVGIGLNVSMTADELPVPTATSLLLAGGTAPDRTELLVDLLAALRTAYDGWQAGGERGDAELRAAYTEACVTVGRDVRVQLPGGADLIGRATGIDPGGRLVVAGPDGPTAVGAGDVVHVRPAGR
ncbi:biotin--[acetyl-CoA-carboxylase] ligase [Nocardioides dongkuii]|uniref:biotin--[acetyl-CoA-carboxylase] ligase n=1 Tax=Nocardioides dongkuii TaxID=2760089 RepID=UPI001FD4B28B|nr:biotin--[acetyl-CoA-carboxylase] ligase [Nocardioides dongkuii]